MASAEDKEEDFDAGKVNRVRRDFSVREDGVLAQRLQQDEFHQHYQLNKYERQSVGQGIRTAKELYIDEVLQAGLVAEKDLEQLKSDHCLATELETRIQQEEERREQEQQNQDQELAKELQEQEALELERAQAMRREKQKELENRELKKLQQAIMGLHTEPEQSSSISTDRELSALTNGENEAGTSGGSAPGSSEMGVRIGVNRFILGDGTEVQLSDDEKERENASIRRKDEARLTPSTGHQSKTTTTPKSLEDHRIAMEMQDREIAKFLQRRELYRLEKQREMQLRRAQSVPEGRMGTNGDDNQRKSDYRRRGTEPRRRLPTYEESLHHDESPGSPHDHLPQDLSTTDVETSSVRSEQVAVSDTSRVRRISRDRSSSPREVSNSPKESRRRTSRNASPIPAQYAVNGEARVSPRDNLSRTSSSSSSRSDRERDQEVIPGEHCGHFHRHRAESPGPRRSSSPAIRKSVSPGSRHDGTRSPEERYAYLVNSVQRHHCRRHHSPDCRVHSPERHSPSECQGHAHVHRKSSLDCGSDSDEYGVHVGRRSSLDVDSDTESQRSGHHRRRRSSRQNEVASDNRNGFDRDVGQRRSGGRENNYEHGRQISRRSSSQGSDVGYEGQGHQKDNTHYMNSPKLRREVHARRSGENRVRAETMDSPTIRARYLALARSRDQCEGKKVVDQTNMAPSPRTVRSSSCSKIKKDNVEAKLTNHEAEAILRRTQQEDAVAAERMKMVHAQSELISQNNPTFEFMPNGLDNGLLPNDDTSLYSHNSTPRNRHTVNIAECIDPTFHRHPTEVQRVIAAPVVRELPPPEPYPDLDEPTHPAPVIPASKRRSSENRKKRDGCKNQ